MNISDKIIHNNQKPGNSPNKSFADGWINKYGISIQWNIISQ